MRPEVVDDPRTGAKLLLPTPMLLIEFIRNIPAHSLVTITELRAELAERFSAATTCPLMTGIFYNIIAGAAEDDLAEGRDAVAPYWRVLAADRLLSAKTPDGPERQAERLRAEGHEITTIRGKMRVA